MLEKIPNSMHFPVRLSRYVTNGIREKGYNTGTFSESIEKKKYMYDASGHHLRYDFN